MTILTRQDEMREIATEWLEKKKERDDANAAEMRARKAADNARISLDKLEKQLGEFVGANIRSRLVKLDGETVTIHYSGPDSRPTIMHYDADGEPK